MLRWAILGTGFISNTVIDAIAASDGSRVDIVAGRNGDTAADFQRRHNIPRRATLRDAVADPDIDVVYIGLPNHQHHPYAIAAAEAGKAVLSEKSLTTTMADAHALIDATTAHGTFFVEGLMYLAHPLYQVLTELLRDGRLGQLRAINGRYGADIASVVNPAGRGTIYNLGCYPLSLAHLVVQTMQGPSAFMDHTLAATGITNKVDGTVCDAALSMTFGCGALATLQSSDNYGNSSDFAIAGDHGVLRFETNPWLPEPGDNIIVWQPHEDAPERIVVSDDHDAFYHQIKMVETHVNAAATQAQRPSPRWRDSLEIMHVLTAWEAACLGDLEA